MPATGAVMTEFYFNDRHDAEAEIRAAVRYLLKEASGVDRGDIVRQIVAIVSEEARGLGENPLDEGMPGG
jgi:acyl-CoA reductase-like NAD-dependent aldehyde dehydrogenase